MRTVAKRASVLITGALAIAASAASSLAASEFEGTWSVQDTGGKPFDIVLGADGSAVAHRGSEDMSGTWKNEDGVAVIRWTEGWTTKISKSGAGYKKTAYKGDTSGAPTNTSDAMKK